jgi:hypothetical protein
MDGELGNKTTTTTPSLTAPKLMVVGLDLFLIIVRSNDFRVMFRTHVTTVRHIYPFM